MRPWLDGWHLTHSHIQQICSRQVWKHPDKNLYNKCLSYWLALRTLRQKVSTADCRWLKMNLQVGKALTFCWLLCKLLLVSSFTKYCNYKMILKQQFLTWSILLQATPEQGNPLNMCVRMVSYTLLWTVLHHHS